MPYDLDLTCFTAFSEFIRRTVSPPAPRRTLFSLEQRLVLAQEVTCQSPTSRWWGFRPGWRTSAKWRRHVFRRPARGFHPSRPSHNMNRRSPLMESWRSYPVENFLSLRRWSGKRRLGGDIAVPVHPSWQNVPCERFWARDPRPLPASPSASRVLYAGTNSGLATDAVATVAVELLRPLKITDDCTTYRLRNPPERRDSQAKKRRDRSQPLHRVRQLTTSRSASVGLSGGRPPLDDANVESSDQLMEKYRRSPARSHLSPGACPSGDVSSPV